MELALSLGDTSKPFKFIDKVRKSPVNTKDFGFCMGLATSTSSRDLPEVFREGLGNNDSDSRNTPCEEVRSIAPVDPPLQLDLLPFPVAPLTVARGPSQIRFPWLMENIVNGPVSADESGRGLDVNRSSGEDEDGAAAVSSPNSAASSFQLDFGMRYGSGASRDSGKRDFEVERAISRCSDEEDNGMTRKKLRLSKEQSAFLEESFKEHNTLNPKQKLSLAKQLNLRPRQVEVWFQNRRARTKLKQTEVDCEYLKRCCDTLTEENRRLQKELQELRALKTSQPYYMQLPATTLTMCPSCERVATTNPSSSSASPTAAGSNPIISTAAKPSPKSKLFPFTHYSQPQP